ncbi:calcium-binding protein [Oceanicella actignis]|uniref:calcium-binding protein n=1 Tax=Oceanicella actignis TaxID=1189325 RepID=UPI0011E7FA78|nr:hypothetical protein [Oceanicella actignis]TYO90208.1 hemolysin type calcium-binding protein [Oceanicella actignis]
MPHQQGAPHNQIHELRSELDHAVGNADKLISDLNIIGNIVGAVGAASGSLELAHARMTGTLRRMDTIEKVAFVLSKLPVVGPLGSGVLFTVKRLGDPLDRSVGLLDQLETPLSTVNSVIGGIALTIGTVNVSTAGVRKIMQDKSDLLTRMVGEGLLQDDQRLGESDQGWYEFLDQANADSDDALAASEPLREELAALDFSVYLEIYAFFSGVNRIFDDIDAALDPIAPALDEIDRALKPVDWAFEAASDVIDRVVRPVVDAVMEATGLDDLIDELFAQLNPAADLMNEMKRNLERMKVELEAPGFADDVRDFYDGLRADLFPDDVAFPAIRDLGALIMENPDGSLVVAGTDGDDTLTGTPLDDDFAGFGGDDDIDGRGGTDRLLLLHRIEDYRLKLLGDRDLGQPLLVEVAARDAAIMSEGVDRAHDVELFNFANPGLGDVPWQAVRQFVYVDGGSADAVGSAGEDWLFGDGRANLLEGRGGDDRLFGGAGNDTLKGEGGDDLVYAGDGDDLIVVGEGADQIYGGAGVDTVVIDAAAGATVDFATSAIDYGAGAAGAMRDVEIVRGTRWADVYLGADGAQSVQTGGGADRFLYAGEGDSFAHQPTPWGDSPDNLPLMSFRLGGYEGVRVEVRADPYDDENSQARHSAKDAPNPRSGDWTVTNVDRFEGTNYGDVFYAYGFGQGATRDRIIYERYELVDGDMVFRYVKNGSIFMGGAGADVFFAAKAGSVFDGGDGFDLVNYNLDNIRYQETHTGQGVQGVEVDLSLGTAKKLQFSGAGAETLADRLIGIEGVVGTRVDDVLIGDNGANYLFGDEGGDVIRGLGGADYVDVTEQIDGDIDAGSGDDIVAMGYVERTRVDGGAGSDTLELKPGQAFRLDAWHEPDVMEEADDRTQNVSGWAVNLTEGSASSQFMQPGDADPFTHVMPVLNFENVFGTERDDILLGDANANTLTGRGGNDRLEGGAGDDALDGGAGSDILIGGDGDDFLSGGDESGVIFTDDFGDPSITRLKFFHGGWNDWFNPAGPIEVWEAVADDADPSDSPVGGTISPPAVPGTGRRGGIVDIDGYASPMDQIYRTLETQVGGLYRVTFAMSDRRSTPYPHYDPGESLEVNLNDASVLNDPTLARVMPDGSLVRPTAPGVKPGAKSGLQYLSSAAEDSWTIYQFEFTGTGEDKLAFAEVSEFVDDQGRTIALTSDGYGPLLGFVTVESLGHVDELTGGGGADVFALTPDGGEDRIRDFTPGEDKISLAAFGAAWADVSFERWNEFRWMPESTQVLVRGQVAGLVVGMLPEELGREDFILAETRSGQRSVQGTEGDDLMDGRDLFGEDGAGVAFAGGAGADELLGTDAPDQLGGGAGDDLLDGRGGDDGLEGGGGDDRLSGGAGADRIEGGQGRDALFGGKGADQLFGGRGADRAFGGGGDDALNGCEGDDRLFGQLGGDTLDGAQGRDRLFGGDGNDLLRGGDGRDALYGGRGADELRGGAGDDLLFGAEGRDLLFGGVGADRLEGGVGDDVMSGGGGGDVFVFADGHGRDVITDFAARSGAEKLDLSGVSALGTLAEALSAARQTADGVLIATGEGDSILLQGVKLGQLDASDFLF